MRKKHNSNLRAIKMTNHAVRDLAVIHTLAGGEESVKMVNIKTGNNVAVGLTLATAMSKSAFKWSILLVVFGRRQDGQEYMKCEQVDTQARYKQADLTEFLNAKHIKMIDEFNDLHFVNVGWIATPYNYEFSEQVAGEYFERLGAWDYLSKWEIQNESN